ncbi:MAG: D-alanyl-D-alanine carboxypeptidase family protein [Sarcina sp.]
MKKIYTLLLSLLLLCSTSFTAISKTIANTARYAVAIDGTTKEILFEKKAFDNVAMASTTKIITALVAINYGNLEDKVVISKNAASIRGSKVGYRANEEIKLKELLWGLMHKSGNDAAIAIAEHLGGSIDGFSVMMNNFSKSIGLIDSNFQSPHGLDSSKHFSTAYDLAIVASVAMENKEFKEIVSTKTLKKETYNFSRDYNNINKILWKIDEANGVKTGYTGQAGKCLVSSIRKNDKNIIIVVLNCNDRWQVTEDIYNYVKNKI